MPVSWSRHMMLPPDLEDDYIIRPTAKLRAAWLNDREALIADISTAANITKEQAKLFIALILSEAVADDPDQRTAH